MTRTQSRKYEDVVNLSELAPPVDRLEMDPDPSVTSELPLNRLSTNSVVLFNVTHAS